MVAERTHSSDAVMRLASHVSSGVDGLFVLSSVETLVAKTKRAVDAAGAASKQGGLVAEIRPLEQYFGIEFDDLDSWKKTGLRTDAPWLIAFGDDPVLVAAVADEERLRRYLEGGDSSKRFDEGDWEVEDGVAFVALDSRRDLANVMRGEGAFAISALADDDGFRQYRRQVLEDRPFGFFVPERSGVYNEIIEGSLRLFSRRWRGPLATQGVWRALAQAGAFGIAGDFDDTRASARAWLQLSDEGVRSLRTTLSAPLAAEWPRHILADAVFVGSMEIDVQESWRWIVDRMDARSRRNAQMVLQQMAASQEIEFDLKRDFIDHLSGNAALAVYPLERKASSRDPMAEDGFGAMVFFSFDDPVVPRRLLGILEKIAARSGGQMAVRTVKGQGAGGTLKMVAFKSGHPPVIYVQGDMVAVASEAFTEEQMRGIFLDPSGEPRLRDAEDLQLGQSMLASPHKNAMYINAQPLIAVAREKGQEFGPWADMLGQGIATLRVVDTGLLAEGEMQTGAALGFVPWAINREAMKSHVYRARRQMHSIARESLIYFDRTQIYCGAKPDCQEPWHDKPGMRRGEPVPADQKVFPGGLHQELSTHAQVPEGGKSVPVELNARHHQQATAQILELDRLDTSPFRFTYITNGMTGEDAEIILRAEADFDPSTAERHTLEMRLTPKTMQPYGRAKISESNAYE